MAAIAKWAWLVLLIILFAGPCALVIIAVDALAVIIVAFIRPEWLSKF